MKYSNQLNALKTLNQLAAKAQQEKTRTNDQGSAGAISARPSAKASPDSVTQSRMAPDNVFENKDPFKRCGVSATKTSRLGRLALLEVLLGSVSG